MQAALFFSTMSPAWSWLNEPVLDSLWLLVGIAYVVAARRRPVPRTQAACFAAGWLLALLALASPLDSLGTGWLFSAHMTQSVLFMYPVPVLLLLGLPAAMADALLRPAVVRGLVGFLTQPLVCVLTYSLGVGLWHMPLLFEPSLHHPGLHAAQLVTVLASALVFWWPQLNRSTVLPRRPYAVQMLIQVGMIVGMTPLFVYIVFSTDILYPTYAQAPRILAGLSAASDQLTAGVIMKLSGLVVALIAITASFYRWYQQNEGPAAGR